MKLPSRFLIVLVLAAVLLSACAVTGRTALIGKWTTETASGQPTVLLEYTTNGKFRQESSGIVQEVNYQFVDDNTVDLLLPDSQGGNTQLKFEVQGDKLTLTSIDPTTNQPGTPTVLTRVK
jgi:hypothetical protein